MKDASKIYVEDLSTRPGLPSEVIMHLNLPAQVITHLHLPGETRAHKTHLT